MRATTLILLAAVFSLAGGAYASDDYTPNAPDVVVLTESTSMVLISLEIPSPTITVLDRGDAGRALSVEISDALPDFDQVGLALPTITKMIAVPAGYSAIAHIRSVEEETFDAAALIPRDEMPRNIRRLDEVPMVEVGQAGWMRWMRVAPVVIHPARYDAVNHRLLVAEHMQIDFEFVPDYTDNVTPPNPERYQSLAFTEFFRGLLLNPAALPGIIPGGSVVTRGSYVIVTDAALARVTGAFADWKRAKGFDVVVKAIYYNGMTAEALKDSIQNWYDTWARPPEYILLLGDYNAAGIRIPAFRIVNPAAQAELDVTDLPYSCLEGNDYFPDIFIGRISADSPSNEIALNGMARSTRHEQAIATFPAANFHRATIWAGNFGDGGQVVLSPVETSEWLATRLRERGWDVETFFYRRPGDNVSPDPIVASINRGVNIASYRGWADANGTHYPQFYRADLERLTNGPLLPVFTTFVCNTGDFGNDQVNPCFGEYSIARGTRPNPLGALAFYGPSDLHTNTRFNNAMLGGYYSGLLYENLRTLGQVILRAKMSVWAANPAFREAGGDNNFVEFYFSVYNILGDPEIMLYMDPPTQLTVNHPAQLSVGESSLRLTVSNNAGPVRGALIHLAKTGETDLSILTDADGVALAPISLLTADTLKMTVIAHQAAPYRASIPVRAAARMVGFNNVTVRNPQGDARVLLGVPLDLTVALKNFGTEALQGVTATLSSPLEGVEIQQAESSFGDLAVGATANGQAAFRVQLANNFALDEAIPFQLAIRDRAGNNYTALFRLSVIACRLDYTELALEGGAINSGEQKTLTITLQNSGTAAAAGVVGILDSFDDAVMVGDNRGVFGDVAVGGTASCAGDAFSLTVNEDAAVGRRLAFRLHLMTAQGASIGALYFSITVGTPGPTDPVGPDAYGYYAYDNTDVNYDSHPTYEWIELDPNFGGAGGTHHELTDDQSFGVDLPFSFRFYGQDFRRIAVCSNGWISFEDTEVWDFNNWPIPSPLGPHSMIAPYWEDLVGPMQEDSVRAPINVYSRYDQAQGRFIVEWSRSVARTGNDIEVTQTLEAILFDPAVRRTRTGDGEILFQYAEARLVDRGREQNYATIGIQDWNHARGLELSFAAHNAAACDTITGGRAILITTNPPDRFNEAGDLDRVAPTAFALGEPFPNPFNARTSVAFDLPISADVRLGLYDLSGRQVQEVISGRYEAGNHRLEFSAQNLTSGLYILRLEADGQSAQRKIALVK